MSATRIANRYAKALYRLAGDDPKKARTFLEQLQTARALFDIEPSARVLNSPVMPQDLKKKLFEAALTSSHAAPELHAFIGALIGAGTGALGGYAVGQSRENERRAYQRGVETGRSLR